MGTMNQTLAATLLLACGACGTDNQSEPSEEFARGMNEPDAGGCPICSYGQDCEALCSDAGRGAGFANTATAHDPYASLVDGGLGAPMHHDEQDGAGAIAPASDDAGWFIETADSGWPFVETADAAGPPVVTADPQAVDAALGTRADDASISAWY